ncbi:hypothetical protein BLOT_014791 [Blomia tropicalis]|nr:hypothetical protein BLOT_014791 [Blomia tropicalis]
MDKMVQINHLLHNNILQLILSFNCKVKKSEKNCTLLNRLTFQMVNMHEIQLDHHTSEENFYRIFPFH